MLLPIAMMFYSFHHFFCHWTSKSNGRILRNQFELLAGWQAQLQTLAVFSLAFMGIPAGKMLEKIEFTKTALTALIAVL